MFGKYNPIKFFRKQNPRRITKEDVLRELGFTKTLFYDENGRKVPYGYERVYGDGTKETTFTVVNEKTQDIMQKIAMNGIADWTFTSHIRDVMKNMKEDDASNFVDRMSYLVESCAWDYEKCGGNPKDYILAFKMQADGYNNPKELAEIIPYKVFFNCLEEDELHRLHKIQNSKEDRIRNSKTDIFKRYIESAEYWKRLGYPDYATEYTDMSNNGFTHLFGKVC
jgi:hypothetical protein